MNGYWRLEGFTSSTFSFSIIFWREVAWRAFALCARKRRTKSSRSEMRSFALALAFSCCCLARVEASM
jgi:hypothetical protein